MDQRLAHEFGRTRVPVTVFQRRLQLQHAHRQQRQQRHQHQADVQAPEAAAQQAFGPLRFRLQAAQAEQHQADAEHAVHAEQRGVAVQRREVQALHVVQRQRRVDQETEQARTDEVPETHREEEHDRPAVALHPFGGAAVAPGVVGLHADQRQRHDFQRGDARAERDHAGGGAGEVQVVEGAEDAAGHEHDGREQHVDGRGTPAHQPELDEQEAHHRDREHLEEAFDPQVHHPPAPVFDRGHVRVLAPHQPGRVQQRDGDGGQEQQADDRGDLVLAPQRRPQRAPHQQQPQQQADEQEDLPETADVGVFPTLVAEPEVVLQAHLLHHREPLPGERADHDHQQAHEQEVHAQALELRFVPGHRRADVQAGGQPRGRDPQHRELRVPAARQRIRQVLRNLEAVGLLAFDLVVRGGGTEQDLHQEQRQHQPEILRGGAHRRRDHDRGERIARRRRDMLFLAVPDRVMPCEQADAGDHEQDAEHRPHERARGRRVAHQRFVRPVAGVGLGFAGALRGRRPCGPEEERGERVAVFRVGDRVLAHRIAFAQLRGRRIVREQAFVVRRYLGDRQRAAFAEQQVAAGRIVGVGAHERLELGLLRGLSGRIERGIDHAVVGAAAEVEHGFGLAVQPVRGPVGRDQRAMAPDRAQLLPADALPDAAAFLDVRARVDDVAAVADHALGDGWRLQVDVPPHPEQYAETGEHQRGQAEPESAGGIHGDPQVG